MGKKSSRKNGVGKAPGSITLREESGVKKKQTHVNAKSMLKLEHIKDIATWASGEGSIPSLGAFFGQRLAVSAESLGVPPDPSLFTCQRPSFRQGIYMNTMEDTFPSGNVTPVNPISRSSTPASALIEVSIILVKLCESILQAGYNCTARMEKNKRKARKKRKTSGIPPKNSVVYECHFCSHRNLKRGTPRGYMKSLYPAKPKTLTVDLAKSATRKAKVDPTESAMQRSEHLGTLVACIDKAKVDPTESAMHKSEHLDTSVASTDKARVDPTESAMQKSEHLDTSVASIDKTRVDTTKSTTQKSEQFDALGGSTTDVIVASELVGDDPMAGPATPLSTVTVTSLLDSKKRKRNRKGSKKKAEPQDGSSMTDAEKTVSTSSKRKKKSWTSLKEIAETPPFLGVFKPGVRSSYWHALTKFESRTAGHGFTGRGIHACFHQLHLSALMSLIYPLIKRKIKASAIFSECNFNFQAAMHG
ncbi:hypothetical protein KY284_019606 [Solanum tuberosum]|nr:hypothetical protein KY284_019606 [Solanum tuberosum]